MEIFNAPQHAGSAPASPLSVGSKWSSGSGHDIFPRPDLTLAPVQVGSNVTHGNCSPTDDIYFGVRAEGRHCYLGLGTRALVRMTQLIPTNCGPCPDPTGRFLWQACCRAEGVCHRQPIWAGPYADCRDRQVVWDGIHTSCCSRTTNSRSP